MKEPCWMALAPLLVAACQNDYAVLFRTPGARDASGPPVEAGIGGEADSAPPLPIVALSATNMVTCVLQGGQAVCWGEGGGTGEPGFWPAPRAIPGSENLASIAVGDVFACGIDTSDTVLCWGVNDQGQLGVGDREPRPSPTRVLLGARARTISAGQAHTCAITLERELWCWGDNEENQLGLGEVPIGTDRTQPVRVGGESDWEDVAVAFGHTCGLRAGGALYCWGRNSDRQLGLGEDSRDQLVTPTLVDTGPWLQVDGGIAHTCGIRADRSLWCWGNGTESRLGTGDPDTRYAVPTRIGERSDFRDLSVGVFSSCALTTDDALYCWGRNVEGQLGASAPDYFETPTPVEAERRWVRVAEGRFHTCAQEFGGPIWCSGLNRDGQLGRGTDVERSREFAPVAATVE